MNRFEQPKPHIGRKLAFLLPVLAFIILLACFLQGIASVSSATVRKQQESLESALSRSISQCYAVEGVYPPSLEYLKEHYGLTYDEDAYFVDYQVYGANLLPDVTVLPSAPSGWSTRSTQ